ncbi:MAG: sugar O-acetyltransferase [Cyanobacteria bacterium P01_H01_bin.162]
MSKTEREKMLANAPYLANDPELVALRLEAAQQLYAFNQSPPDHALERVATIQALFDAIGSNCEIYPRFHCDYGRHIKLGKNVYINVNCTILDCNWVTIGDDVLMGPNVQIYTAYHPTNPQVRLTGVEMAAPITIGRNVWLGGGVIVCPGVTIGDNTTIGAGSVVTKSIPSSVVAVGNPCRVQRFAVPSEA